MERDRDYSVNYFYIGERNNLSELELTNNDYCLIKVVTGHVFCITPEAQCLVCSDKLRRPYYAKNITDTLTSAFVQIKSNPDMYENFKYPAVQIIFCSPTGIKPTSTDYLMFNYFIFHGLY